MAQSTITAGILPPEPPLTHLSRPSTLAGMPTLILVRHGRSTANTAGVLAGRTPGVGLDERGAEQAAALPARLSALAPVLAVSSPLERF